MGLNREADILKLISRLDDEISLARSHSLNHIVELLQMATLELKLVLHSISDAELRGLTNLIEKRQRADQPVSLRSGTK